MSAATAHAEILIGAAAPLTGDNSWYGEHVESAIGMAVAELNEAGGILGQTVRAIIIDDYCRGDQAVAAARKLVADGVVFVAGHPCSGAAIPASKVYEQAGVLMIASTASNPKLTDEGGPNVFRMVGRDDQQGRIAGDYLADRHGGAEIAILHDGEAYGQGLAEQTKRQLNERGIQEVFFEPITPGERDYTDVLSKMKSAGVDVLYYGGYSTEAALMIRQARDLGYDVQLISGDGLSTEQFWLVAGPAGEGVLFTSFPDPSSSPEAAEVVRRFRAQNFEPGRDTLYTYASMQAWAQAVEAAGTLELNAVIRALRGRTFDTVLGTVGFDENGDVTGPDTFVWYIWKDGDYRPLLSE
jgi:branched-chain amino acid transport system substrate-binding protein